MLFKTLKITAPMSKASRNRTQRPTATEIGTMDNALPEEM
jgi:hypothetical protein